VYLILAQLTPPGSTSKVDKLPRTPAAVTDHFAARTLCTHNSQIVQIIYDRTQCPSASRTVSTYYRNSRLHIQFHPNSNTARQHLQCSCYICHQYHHLFWLYSSKHTYHQWVCYFIENIKHLPSKWKSAYFIHKKIWSTYTSKLCFSELRAATLYQKYPIIYRELRDKSSTDLEFIKSPTSKISSKRKLWTPCPHHTIQRGSWIRLERGMNYDFIYTICYLDPDPHLHSAMLLKARWLFSFVPLLQSRTYT